MKRAAWLLGEKSSYLGRFVPFRGVVPLSIIVMACLNVSSAAYCDLIVRPDSPYGSVGSLVNSVFGDYPDGWGTGSWAAGGTGVVEVYFTPEMLFGKPVKIGDIKSVSFYTKKGSTHTNPDSAGDWFFTIYTTPFAGGWYGFRISAEPYFSENLTDPANQWNRWSSDQGSNWLRFYVSGMSGASTGYFGSYTDLHLEDFKNQVIDGRKMADQTIEYFRMATATAWASGFTGQLDGLTITLTDGSVARVNFEPVPEPGSLVGLVSLGLLVPGWRMLRGRKRSVDIKT